MYDRKATFNNVTRLYHTTRPRYPEVLFDALREKTGIQNHAHVVEIGPGTGQATESLAKCGYTITAVELGEDIAAFAREALRKHPNVTVVTGSFEEAVLQNNTFDMCFAATSLHWIREDQRFVKPYRLLKHKGYLARVHMNHLLWDDGAALYNATLTLWEKYQKEFTGGFMYKNLDDIVPYEYNASLFANVYFGTYPCFYTYSAEEYVNLGQTYSSTQSLNKKERKAFCDELRHLVCTKFGGSVTKHYAMSLHILQKI